MSVSRLNPFGTGFGDRLGRDVTAEARGYRGIVANRCKPARTCHLFIVLVLEETSSTEWSQPLADLWLLLSLNPSSSALPVVRAQPNLRLHSPMPPAVGQIRRNSSVTVCRCVCLTSRGPGLWSGQSGKELVSVGPFLHPETEQQATEVGRSGSGVWLEHRSLAWSQVPCAKQWLTVGPAQLIPFGRVSSMAQLGRCLQLRKRATSEKDTER